MTDLKFDILKLLYNSYPLRERKFGEIIESVSADPTLIINALKELQSPSHMLVENLTCSDVYKLTALGAEVYEQLQEEREQASKTERQQSFDNKIAVASLLVPFITFVLGLLVDHYTDLVSFLLSLFK